LNCKKCGKQITKYCKGGLCRSCARKGKIPWNKGKLRTEETKKKISDTLSNKNHPRYKKALWNEGKTGVYSEETLKKMSESHKGKTTWIKGKHHTKETLKKMSDAKKGKSLSKEHKKNISEANKGEKNSFYGKKHTKESKQKIRKARKKQIFTEETKRKMRLSRIKEIEEKNGICFPNYNKQACEHFKNFDKINNTKGRYAMYGGGEYFIKELGYWPDYINFDMKLIIEWDEPWHNKQKQKDKQRQKEIMAYYPDFEFRRIKK